MESTTIAIESGRSKHVMSGFVRNPRPRRGHVACSTQVKIRYPRAQLDFLILVTYSESYYYGTAFVTQGTRTLSRPTREDHWKLVVWMLDGHLPPGLQLVVRERTNVKRLNKASESDDGFIEGKPLPRAAACAA